MAVFAASMGTRDLKQYLFVYDGWAAGLSSPRRSWRIRERTPSVPITGIKRDGQSVPLGYPPFATWESGKEVLLLTDVGPLRCAIGEDERCTAGRVFDHRLDLLVESEALLGDETHPTLQ